MILGIDPGVRKLGYALITPEKKIIDAGILLLEEKNLTREKYFQRILEISNFFDTFFSSHPAIKAISIEKLFFTHSNQSNAEFVYGIRAILIEKAMKLSIKVHEFSPIELKKNITGNGKAEKILVQSMIMKIFNLTKLPEFNDTADALWLAYLWLQRSK